MANRRSIPWTAKAAIIAAVITAIAIIIAALISPIGGEFVTVQGVVTNNDGNPIKNAAVEIDGSSVLTGADGRYVINNVPIGTKTITVRTPGAEVVKRALKISKSDGIIIYDIALPPSTLNESPIALFSYAPHEPKMGDEITLDASQSYDPDGKIEEYEWNFGDGSKAKGVLVKYSYSKSGTFTVKLTVTDDKGAKNVKYSEIKVISMEKIVNVPDAFYPSGWMGDWEDITLDDASTDNSHSEPTCIKITYSAAQSQGKGWAGIYWQYPDNNWGDKPGGHDLTGATKLTFWARGEKSGETAEFKVGGITGKYSDSIQSPVSTGVIVLSDKWQKYTIDLTGKDLSQVIGGFCWVTHKNQNPHGCAIYLDDLGYEWV